MDNKEKKDITFANQKIVDVPMEKRVMLHLMSMLDTTILMDLKIMFKLLLMLRLMQ